MLTVKNICKNFGDKQVLDNVNFKLAKNGVVGLLGPNGAGKTTLMRIIVGFYLANRGKLYWAGKEVDSKDENYRLKIGYLPENNPLYQGMTVSEYLYFVAQLKDADKKQVSEVAASCGLGRELGQKIETLSRGFRQRVGLAAALMGKPKMLILDEPTSGLDPNQIIEIKKLIGQLAKRKIVLLSTHILPDARDICHRLLIINQGKIVLDEETRKIKNLEKKFVELTV